VGAPFAARSGAPTEGRPYNFVKLGHYRLMRIARICKNPNDLLLLLIDLIRVCPRKSAASHFFALAFSTAPSLEL
jgi:hypothetical protein